MTKIHRDRTESTTLPLCFRTLTNTIPGLTYVVEGYILFNEFTKLYKCLWKIILIHLAWIVILLTN